MGEAEAPVPSPPQADAAMVARLDAFLRRDRAYLDPDLSLQRLARRLHLPEKRLSMAVNRATGGNVSRHINGWRIDHACALIGEGQGITEAMLASGFNTKSNFNREFLRIKGAKPVGMVQRRAPRFSGRARFEPARLASVCRLRIGRRLSGGAAKMGSVLARPAGVANGLSRHAGPCFMDGVRCRS